MDPATKKLLLVADDYADAAAVLAELIELASDFAVIYVMDGGAAVRQCMARRPAVVLLDIDMPVLNGIEAAREITALLGSARPQLYAFTGGTRVAEARNAEVFDRAFSKPIDVDDLVSFIGSMPS